MIQLHKFYKREFSAATKNSSLQEIKKERRHIPSFTGFYKVFGQIFNCLKNCRVCPRWVFSQSQKIMWSLLYLLLSISFYSFLRAGMFDNKLSLLRLRLLADVPFKFLPKRYYFSRRLVFAWVYFHGYTFCIIRVDLFAWIMKI